MNDPVYFFLPILTCMSFYGENTTNPFEEVIDENNQAESEGNQHQDDIGMKIKYKDFNET